jgi:hypothetical protein
LFIATGAGLLLWFLQLAIVRWTVSADEDAYNYLGYAWHMGDYPYRDTYENKPPGIHLVFKLTWDYLHGSPVFPRLAAILLTLTAAALIAIMALRLWKSHLALLAGPVFLAITASPYADGALADCETFGVFFTAAGAFLILRPDHPLRLSSAFSAGLLCGCALLFRPQFIVDAFAFLTLLLVIGGARKFALAAALVLALPIPMAACLAYFYKLGIVGDYFHVIFQAVRGSMPDAAGRIVGFWNFLHFFSYPIAGVAMVFGITTAFMARRSEMRTSSIIYLGWILAALAAILSQGWCTGHQFKHICLPLSLLLPGIFALGRPATIKCAEIVLAVAMLLAIWPATQRARASLPKQSALPALGSGSTPGPAQSLSLQQVIDSHATVRERIWCYPTRGAYVRFKRLSACRHYNDTYFSMPAAQDEVIVALTSGKAKLVLMDEPHLDEMVNGIYGFRSPPEFRSRLTEILRKYFKDLGIYEGWHVYLYGG